MSFSILHPLGDDNFEGNNASCVLLVEAGEHRLLVGGDIEESAEQELVRRGVLPRVTVAIVPHHGSRTSSTLSFVKALGADIAVVSAGFGNRWGFPREDVVRRWQSAGTMVLETAYSGAVHARICAATGIERLERYRSAHRRIWHE